MTRRHPVRVVVHRTLALAMLWVALAEGNAEKWWLGLTAAAAAAAASLVVPVAPPWRLDWRRMLGSAGFVLRGAVAGGAQVARLAWAPRHLDPGMVIHRMRLVSTPARVLTANLVSLLPGTLTADLHGDQLHVHVLTRGPQTEAGIAAVEERVGAAFGEPLRGARGGPGEGSHRR